MATDRNRITDADVQAAYQGPTWCFEITKSDTNYITHPNTTLYPNKPLVTAGISFYTGDTIDTITLEFWDGTIISYSGAPFVAGVIYPFNVIRVSDFGTFAALGWFGEGLRNMRVANFPLN